MFQYHNVWVHLSCELVHFTIFIYMTFNTYLSDIVMMRTNNVSIKRVHFSWDCFKKIIHQARGLRYKRLTTQTAYLFCPICQQPTQCYLSISFSLKCQHPYCQRCSCKILNPSSYKDTVAHLKVHSHTHRVLNYVVNLGMGMCGVKTNQYK